jgi:hypothetical protein
MNQRRTVPLEPVPARQPRPAAAKRGIILALTFLLGVVFGAVFMVLYALSLSGGAPVLAQPPPPESSAIRLQIAPAYITQLVTRDLHSIAVDSVSNVSVTLAAGDQLTVNGDDQLLFGLTRPFSIVIQPFVSACQMKVHVLHATLSGIAITGFVRNFEGQIDQQLAHQPTNFPSGFVYCQTGVSTQPQGLYLTYSARAL